MDKLGDFDDLDDIFDLDSDFDIIDFGRKYIVKTLVADDGYLYILYDDGIKVKVGKVVGKDGLSIKNFNLSEDGYLSVTMSDNSIKDIGLVVGQKGDKGDTGKTGKTGKKGDKGDTGNNGLGIVSTDLQSNGDLYFYYSDSTKKKVGNIKGQDGKDGISIVDCEINKDGELELEFSDGKIINLGKVVGEKGFQGYVGGGGGSNLAAIAPLFINSNNNTIYLDLTLLADSFIPYTGATQDVDLGSNNLTTTGQIINRDVQASLSHGVHSGCRVSIDVGDTEISISAGTYTIVDSWTDPQVPITYDVTYAGDSAVSVTGLASADYTYILLDKDGNIFQLTQYPNDEQRRTYVTLAQIEHPNRTTIAEINEITDVYASPVNLSRDVLRIIGMINKGNVISPNGANLKFSRSAGSIFEEGVNFHVNNKRPNIIDISAEAESLFNRRTQTGLGDDDVDVLDVANYDVAGTITAVPSVGYTNQRVFLPPTGATVVQYGQVVYDTLAEAVAGVFSENFTALPSVVDHAILIGVISVASNATDLSNSSQAVFIEAGKFGELIGGSKGTSTTTLQQAHDNSAVPKIVTSASSGAVIFQRGSSDDSDVVVEGQNGAGSTTYSLTGDGVVTADTFVGGLAESNVVFTDITSNNASTSKHGFLPKLSGVTTEYLNGDGDWVTVSSASGDVVGPASSVDNAVARYDGTTGKLIQNSGVTIDDNNLLTTPTITVNGSSTTTHEYNHIGFGANYSLYGEFNETLTITPLTNYATAVAWVRGVTFTPSTNLTITHLGVYNNGFVSGSRDVGIYNSSTQELIASATVDYTDPDEGNFKYVLIPTATLISGTQYYVVSVLPASMLYLASNSTCSSAVGTLTTGSNQIQSTTLTFPNSSDPFTRYPNCNFKYATYSTTTIEADGVTSPAFFGDGSALTGIGDVVGPASATDNAVVRYDSTTGKLIQNSGVTIDDNAVITNSGITINELTSSDYDYNHTGFGSKYLLHDNTPVAIASLNTYDASFGLSTGNIGLDFTFNTAGYVTDLGIFDLAFPSGNRDIGLFNNSGTLVASGSVTFGTTAESDYKYVSITPFFVESGETYRIVVHQLSGDDAFLQNTPTLSVTYGTFGSASFVDTDGSLDYPTTNSGAFVYTMTLKLLPLAQILLNASGVSAPAFFGDGSTLTGIGDVVGPASSTDNAITRYDGTTGKLVQNSGATIDDSGNLTANNISGTNTGDITVSGENYLSLASQAITVNAIDLSGSNVTNSLPETSISFTDITTNNASVSAHGFLPKLSDVSTEFLNGKGVWSPIGGGDVSGSGTGIDNAIVTLNGTSGTTIQGSSATVSDDGIISSTGLTLSNPASLTDNLLHTGFGAEFNCTSGLSIIELSFTGSGSSATGSNYTFGFEFTVGASDIIVSELGIYSNGWVSANRRCGIWNTSGTLLTSVTIPIGATDESGHKYASITPYTLLAGNTYRIGAEVLAADTYYFSFGSRTFQNVTYVGTFGNLSSSFAYPTSSFGTFYAGPNFKTIDVTTNQTTIRYEGIETEQVIAEQVTSKRFIAARSDYGDYLFDGQRSDVGETFIYLYHAIATWGSAGAFASERYIQTGTAAGDGRPKDFHVGAGGVTIGYPNTPVYNSYDALYINGNVGIGTATPTGRFEIKGTDSSVVTGAHVRYTGSADNYPLFQQLNWTHDNVAMSFDAYWSGSAWISSDSGSNYQIYKISDQLRFMYNSGTTAGGAITWNVGFSLNTSGNVGIGTTSPTEKLTITGNIRCYGVYSDYIIYIDQKTTGTPAGSSGAGWQTRALNWIQEEKDSGSYFSGLGSNQFQLAAGRYFVEAIAPSYNCRRQKLALINVTDSTVAIVGDAGQHPAAGAGASTAMRGQVNIASTKAFELRHFTQDAVGTYGLGVETNASGYTEKYATVIVTRLGN